MHENCRTNKSFLFWLNNGTSQETESLKLRINKKYCPTTTESDDVKYGRCEHPREIIEMIITDIQTHEKYRVLKVLHAFAHFLTNGAFVSLIFVIFILQNPGNESKDNSNINTEPTIEQIIQNPFLVFVILLDAFYGILIKNVHIWMINRLGLYIPLLFNLSYLIIFTIKHIWTNVIIILYILRIFAYLYETFIVYCLDLEIAYDLAAGKIMELWRCDDYKQICARYNNQTTERLFNRTRKHHKNQYLLILHETRVFYFKCIHTDCNLNVNIADDDESENEDRCVSSGEQHDNILEMPQGTIYCGSICSWTIFNVFKGEPVKEDAEKNCGSWHWFTRWCIRIMVATIPLLLDMCIAVLAAFVSLVGYLCVMIYNCCKSDCIKFDYKNLMIGEMFHEKAT